MRRTQQHPKSDERDEEVGSNNYQTPTRGVRNEDDEEEEDDYPDISPSDTQITAADSFDQSPVPSFEKETPKVIKNKPYDGSTNSIGDNNNKNTDKNVLTIEHKTGPATTGNGKRSLLLGMSKPMIGLVAFMTLGASGTLGYSIFQWLRIPGLESQIQQLEAEVTRLNGEIDRLASEVDRLSEQNDRLEVLNDSLNASIIELDSLNDQLNASNLVYEGLNEDFNVSILELQLQVTELEEQNEDYANLNQQLNNTNQALHQEVDRLTNATTLLEEQNAELYNLTLVLGNEIASLIATNGALNANVVELESIVVDLEGKVLDLESLNDDLQEIADYLNETAIDLDASYEQLASDLASLVDANEVFLFENMYQTDRNVLIRWDCDFVETFGYAEWARDETIPIGADDYPSVASYLEEILLTELCLDLDDFELFLDRQLVRQGQIPPVNTNVDQFKAGVNQYTNLALDYYFPDAGETGGLTPDDWAAASYRCEFLKANQTFSLYS